MRWSVYVVVSMMAVGGAGATTPYVSTETLAGWSEDGERFAVIANYQGQDMALVVRERAKTIATFEAPVPDNGGFGPQPAAPSKYPEPSKIDVEKWEPIKKHGLKKIESAARKRFDTELEVKTAGTREEAHRCKNASWTLLRKGTTKVIHEVKATGNACFIARGGYLHANGKRALVKLTESKYSNPGEGGDTSDDTKFVLVDIPPKP
jgi:hypothetical protein